MNSLVTTHKSWFVDLLECSKSLFWDYRRKQNLSTVITPHTPLCESSFEPVVFIRARKKMKRKHCRTRGRGKLKPDLYTYPKPFGSLAATIRVERERKEKRNTRFRPRLVVVLSQKGKKNENSPHSERFMGHFLRACVYLCRCCLLLSLFFSHSTVERSIERWWGGWDRDGASASSKVEMDSFFGGDVKGVNFGNCISSPDRGRGNTEMCADRCCFIGVIHLGEFWKLSGILWIKRILVAQNM